MFRRPAYRTSAETWRPALAPALGPPQGSEEAAGRPSVIRRLPTVWSLQCLVLDAETTNTPRTEGWARGAALIARKGAPVLCPSAFPRSPQQGGQGPPQSLLTPSDKDPALNLQLRGLSIDRKGVNSTELGPQARR